VRARPGNLHTNRSRLKINNKFAYMLMIAGSAMRTEAYRRFIGDLKVDSDTVFGSIECDLIDR